MKLTKMAGAFALTAAMAMTAVPAFAAADASNVDQFKDTTVSGGAQSAEATTKVYAETINQNLNATIPTRVAIVVPSSNIGDIQGPSSDVYKIVNKGTSDIKLNSVAAAPGLFKLSTADLVAASLTEPTMKLTLTAGSTNTVLSGTATQSLTPVTIAKNNGECGLTLSGKSFVPTSSPLSAASLESPALQITYTIGA